MHLDQVADLYHVGDIRSIGLYLIGQWQEPMYFWGTYSMDDVIAITFEVFAL
jgi:hypothetical protein